MGVHSTYNQYIADKICEAISNSDKGLNAICKENSEFPDPATVYRWLNDNEDFCKKYARAREEQADFLSDQIIEIADDSSGDLKINKETGEEYLNQEFAQRSKLRVDARKWKASKLAPKKYGDKTDITTDNQPIQNNISLEALALIAQKLNAKKEE